MSRLFHFLLVRWRWLCALAAAGCVTIAGLNYWMVKSCSPAVYRDTAQLPSNEVGLVLGTGRLLRSGKVNPHFAARIHAAAELYRAGKVKHLLLSGDNHSASYDEPTDMKNALLGEGIPENAMTLDFAGFRTLDSVIRARQIFGLSRLTLITDDFHAPRAVFLARHSGLEAVAFAADPVPMRASDLSRVREVAARFKAVMDIYVLHRGPKYLGPKVRLQLSENP